MISSSLTQHPNHVAPMPSNLNGEGVLKLAAIYGANAAGKTKIVDGIRSLRAIVSNTRSPGKRLPVSTFKLSASSVNKPVRYEIEFSTNLKTFQYGLMVSADGTKIDEEWLYLLSGRRQTKCFERKSENNDAIVDIGPGFAKRDTLEFNKLKLISSATTENQPFLTKAWENKSEIAATVVNWFKHNLIIISADADYGSLEFQAASDDNFSTFLGNYLQSAGTGIEKILSEEEVINLEDKLSSVDKGKLNEILRDLDSGSGIILSSPSGNISKISKKPNGEIVEYKLKAGHKNDSNDFVYFDFNNESHGTQRLTHLLPALYAAKNSPRVYIIDELDRKLHPLLTRKFINDFASSATPPYSQLIFTTHDTNLLDQENLRRDEIWFVEKNRSSGEATLYPLTDFDIRADLHLDRGYLNGRFGGIPFFESLNPPTERD